MRRSINQRPTWATPRRRPFRPAPDQCEQEQLERKLPSEGERALNELAARVEKRALEKAQRGGTCAQVAGGGFGNSVVAPDRHDPP